MSSTILHVGADPTDLVDRAIREDAVDRVVVEFGALLDLHDSVESGLSMIFRMEKIFRPQATGLAVRLPDLADVHVPAAALMATLEAVGAASARLRGRLDAVLFAGATREYISRGGAAKAARAFAQVRYADEPAPTAISTARRLADAATAGSALRGTLDAVSEAEGNFGKSDLLNALVGVEPLRPGAHLEVSRILADTYYAHAVLGGDLNAGDNEDGLRMSSPSFSFVLGACRVLQVIARQASSRTVQKGDKRPSTTSRYDKASYLIRRRMGALPEPLPLHPSCIAALMESGR